MPVPTYIIKEAVRELERGSVSRARTLLEEALRNEVPGRWYCYQVKSRYHPEMIERKVGKPEGWRYYYGLHNAMRNGRTFERLVDYQEACVSDYEVQTEDGQRLTLLEFMQKYPPKTPIPGWPECVARYLLKHSGQRG